MRGNNIHIRLRAYCPVKECPESYVYHTSLATHLISKHDYEKDKATLAVAEAKAEAVKLEVFGELPQIFELTTRWGGVWVKNSSILGGAVSKGRRG